ncbi:hypothetical protein ACVWY7_001217 [Bacillus sp. TE9106W]
MKILEVIVLSLIVITLFGGYLSKKYNGSNKTKKNNNRGGN